MKRYLESVPIGGRRPRYEQLMQALADVAQDPSHPAWPKAMAMVLERTDGAVAKTLKIEGELPLKVVVRGERDG